MDNKRILLNILSKLDMLVSLLENKKRAKNWFALNKDHIFVIVTIVLIVVTCSLIYTTEKLRETSLFLEKERRIELIRNNIDLASDLKTELKNNEGILEGYLKSLPSKKTDDTYKINILQTVELENANKKVGFGNDSIRSKIKIYIIYFDLLKTHLQSMNRPQGVEKNNSIDRALNISNTIYYGKKNVIKINTFQSILEDYINAENKKIDILEEQLFIDLSKE